MFDTGKRCAPRHMDHKGGAALTHCRGWVPNPSSTSDGTRADALPAYNERGSVIHAASDVGAGWSAVTSSGQISHQSDGRRSRRVTAPLDAFSIA